MAVIAVGERQLQSEPPSIGQASKVLDVVLPSPKLTWNPI